VRKAISLALDRPQLLGLIKFGRGEILAGGSIPSTHWAHLPESPYAKPDLDQARRRLNEAGIEPPLHLTLTVGSDFTYQVDAAQVVKQQVSKAGIELRIEALESGIFFDKLNRVDFELTLVGWLGFVDPDEWLYELFHSAGKWNQQGYANPQVDRLLEQGRRETDPAARSALYQQVQRLLLEEVPMAFLYLNDQISAQGPSVQDFAPHPTGTLRGLRHSWLWRPEP
jgi:peptide/nickel transport system substrate-binding protein